MGNVIIRKPATEGMGDRKKVILQAHLDMVPQKNSNSQHDFEKDPIKPRVEEAWVKATGTTLGADNGIGAAAAMAVLESKDIPHPDLEVLLTCDEETGMTGANGLKSGVLHGDILINMDSEDEGELYIGCAGGVNTNAKFHYETVEVPANMLPYKISITGLKGGHSGLDIHLGRGNANKIMCRLLMKCMINLVSGLQILREVVCVMPYPEKLLLLWLFLESNKDALKDYVAKFVEKEKAAFREADPGLLIDVKTTKMPKNLMDEKSQINVVKAVLDCP